MSIGLKGENQSHFGMKKGTPKAGGLRLSRASRTTVARDERLVAVHPRVYTFTLHDASPLGRGGLMNGRDSCATPTGDQWARGERVFMRGEDVGAHGSKGTSCPTWQ